MQKLIAEITEIKNAKIVKTKGGRIMLLSK